MAGLDKWIKPEETKGNPIKKKMIKNREKRMTLNRKVKKPKKSY